MGMSDEDTKAAFHRLSMEVKYQQRIMTELKESGSARELGRMGKLQIGNDDNFDAEDQLPIVRRPTLDIPSLPMPSGREIAAIDKIFRHPWWHRIWVVQEASVAKELTVICGTESISWSYLCHISPEDSDIGHLQVTQHEKNLAPPRKINSTLAEGRGLA